MQNLKPTRSAHTLAAADKHDSPHSISRCFYNVPKLVSQKSSRQVSQVPINTLGACPSDSQRSSGHVPLALRGGLRARHSHSIKSSGHAPLIPKGCQGMPLSFPKIVTSRHAPLVCKGDHRARQPASIVSSGHAPLALRGRLMVCGMQAPCAGGAPG